MSKLDQRREEFFRYVWDHTADPFVIGYEARAPLTDKELEWLRQVYQYCRADVENATPNLKELLVSNGASLTALLLQVSGLTRNKVVSDLKASLGKDSAPKSYKQLHKFDSGVRYLVRRLKRVFEPLYRSGIESDADTLRGVLEALSQATYPGYIRQERAKRQGHMGEQRLAELLHALGVPFEPEEKLEQPISRDVVIWDVSFDLVVPDSNDPRVLVQSMIQSANIGMFGQSKSDEVKKAMEAIRQNCPNAPPPFLVALVDGVGFESNAEGLKTVLTTADEFVQFKTLWKFAIVVAHAVNRVLLVQDYPELENFAEFLSRYRGAYEIREQLPSGVEAGFTRVAFKASPVPQAGKASAAGDR
ncbi:MAG: hypothetical protein K6U77_08695 [Armatimonadetes bacterium]|nr:hypothetical protein [Armatimonadota bacterium]